MRLKISLEEQKYILINYDVMVNDYWSNKVLLTKWTLNRRCRRHHHIFIIVLVKAFFQNSK